MLRLFGRLRLRYEIMKIFDVSTFSVMCVKREFSNACYREGFMNCSVTAIVPGKVENFVVHTSTTIFGGTLPENCSQSVHFQKDPNVWVGFNIYISAFSVVYLPTSLQPEVARLRTNVGKGKGFLTQYIYVFFYYSTVLIGTNIYATRF